MNNIEAVIQYFGSKYQLAKALGVNPSAVSRWKECMPKGRAYQVEVLAEGKFKAVNLIYGHSR